MFVINVQLVLVTVVAVIFSWNLSVGKVEQINPAKAEDCLDPSDSYIEFQNVSIRAVARGKYTISASIVVKKNLNEPLMLRLKTQRCKDAASDACILLTDVEFASLCARLKDEDAVWTPFFEHMNGFERNCPIKAGRYSLQNYAYEVEDFENLPLGNGYWKCRTEISQITFGKLKAIMCFDAEIEVITEE